MTQMFKKLSEEIKAKISEQIQSKEMQDFIAATKAAEDSGSFEVIISTGDVDRDGESIDQSGWDFTFYKMNPIVLWAHDYGSLPIAVTDEVKTENGKTIARGRFAPESANPFAQQVRQLYDLKIIQATSVGFIVRETDGKTITKAELLEFSFVPVPANPYAISLIGKQKLDIAEFVAKGILTEEKTAVSSEAATTKDEPPEVGDDCVMLDGSPGQYIDDEGEIICAPKVEEKPAGAIAQYQEIDAELQALDENLKTAVIAHGESTKTAVVATHRKILEILNTDESKDIKAEKIGRVLSESNRAKIKSAIENMKSTVAALEELLQATDPEGGEGEEARDGGAPKQRSNGAGYGEKEELHEFLSQRHVLRLVNNVTSEALRKLNERSRPKAYGSKRS